MENILFFDSGPIITIITSRLVWILEPLKKQFGGKFYITPAVQHELVERPLNTRRFQFEALQVLKLIREGVLEVSTTVPQKKAQQLSALANSSFLVKGNTMDIVQAGEMEVVAAALATNSAVVIDERTIRLLIEKSANLQKLLEYRFHKNIEVNKDNLAAISTELRGLTVIRSTELIAVAYKIGLLDSYLPPGRNSRTVLIEALLWTAKSNGCSLTDHEVEELKQLLLQ